jgi:hypothetical protein
VKQQLRELLDARIIRESESPFASPIVIVKKKNRKIRLCGLWDYLLAHYQGVYALPNLKTPSPPLMVKNSSLPWTSKSGYYEVKVAEEYKHKTAFMYMPAGHLGVQ